LPGEPAKGLCAAGVAHLIELCGAISEIFGHEPELLWGREIRYMVAGIKRPAQYRNTTRFQSSLGVLVSHFKLVYFVWRDGVYIAISRAGFLRFVNELEVRKHRF
jgi:hypothetical protein